eukprot:sb/3466816/
MTDVALRVNLKMCYQVTREDTSCPSGLLKPQLWEILKVCYKMLPASPPYTVPADTMDLRESFAKLQKDLISTISSLVKPATESEGSEGGNVRPKEPEIPEMKHYVNITTGGGQGEEESFSAKKWTEFVKPKVESALKTIPVVRARINSDHTRLYFPDEDQMKEAEKVLTPLASDCSLTFFSEETKKLDPKGTINDLDAELLEKEALLAAILDKNEDIKKLVDEGKTLKVVFLNKRDRYAVIQTAPEIRRIILDKKDRINIGLRQHLVRNRYHVVQCYNCQAFGHMAGSVYCPRKEDPVCCFCAGGHQTKKSSILYATFHKE